MTRHNVNRRTLQDVFASRVNEAPLVANVATAFRANHLGTVLQLKMTSGPLLLVRSGIRRRNRFGAAEII